MGLFIGASIMTILELFDYVYEVIKVSFFSDYSSLKIKILKEKSWGKTLRKRKREKEIATARAIIEEYRQRNGMNIQISLVVESFFSLTTYLQQILDTRRWSRRMIWAERGLSVL